jgi:hypothetical protein
MVASSLELLYGHMRVFWEEYDIPLIVTHSSRPIAAIRSNEATSKRQLRGAVLVREEESACEEREVRYIVKALSRRKAQRSSLRRAENQVPE